MQAIAWNKADRAKQHKQDGQQPMSERIAWKITQDAGEEADCDRRKQAMEQAEGRSSDAGYVGMAVKMDWM